jgi:hypothetical protein
MFEGLIEMQNADLSVTDDVEANDIDLAEYES